MLTRLITRTLTKYPVDYALYRELLQNSADARATSVEIKFYSDESHENLSIDTVPSVHSIPISRLTVRNNGAAFNEDDWSRLKEIAKGNPNETKIGAFGVGFYSVFELTDEPLVHSGNTVMNFYYKGDQLHFKRTELEPGSQPNQWTIVDIPYRAPGKMPNLIAFTAFLTQSFALVPLLNVDVFVDDVKLLELRKTVSDEEQLQIPKTINPKSSNGTLSLIRLASERFQISVTYMNITQMEDQSQWNKSLFGFGKKMLSLVTSSKNPSDMTTTVCFLRRVAADLKVSVSSIFASKMKATVMKAPAKIATMSMVVSNYEESQLSQLQPPLSDYLFPREFADAKIFIGFPTKQTPGLRCHMSMNQLIPTMERTAVDLSNAYVKEWNEQMLYMGGVVARATYELEMSSISNDIEDASAYVMSRFEMDKSTPDQLVGRWMRSGFWNCDRKSLKVPTHDGKIMDSINVRTTTANFLTNTPVLSSKAKSKASKFIATAIELGFLKEVSHADVARDLQSHTLDSDNVNELVLWILDEQTNGCLAAEDTRMILDAAVACGPGDNALTVVLGTVRTFQNKYTLDNVPLPPTCIPYGLISKISVSCLHELGWKELSVADWVMYIVKERTSLGHGKDLTVDEAFSVMVLEKISQFWNSMSTIEKQSIYNELQSLTCIPTNKGMQKPSDAYLAEIALFPNLPVKLSGLTASHDFLFQLGMRKSVEVSFVLEKLDGTDAESWSVADVVKYLTSQRRLLKKTDWQFLKDKPFLKDMQNRPYRANELFAPDDALSRMKNMKVLKYEYWNSNSPEAQLLFEIGLRPFPSLAELFADLQHISSSDADLALTYYLEKHLINAYSSRLFYKLNPKIIPCAANDSKEAILRGPQECYSTKEVSLFGYPIIVSRLSTEASKLGVQAAPSVSSLVQRLVAHPSTTLSEAEAKFIYLSTKTQELKKEDIELCRKSRIIPLETGQLQYPVKTFLVEEALASRTRDTFFYEFFDFVKISSSATPFLLAIGVRYEPSVSEIAALVAQDPLAIYRRAGGPIRYQKLLAIFAEKWDILTKQNPALAMSLKQSPCLIGYKAEPTTSNNNLEIEEVKPRPQLLRAAEIVIADDIILYNQFKSYVATAPEDGLLEGMYQTLGSRLLSEVVERTVKVGNQLQGYEKEAQEIQSRVAERTVLFLEGTREKRRIKTSSISKIQVVVVDSIRKHGRIRLPGQPSSPEVVEEVSAWINPSYVLHICLNGFDWFDVSQTLIKIMLERPNPDSAIVLDLQLRSSLKQLERRGYNVDRLLRKEEERRLMEEEVMEIERKRVEEQRKLEEQKMAERRKEMESTQTERQKEQVAPGFPRQGKSQEQPLSAQQQSGPVAQRQPQPVPQEDLKPPQLPTRLEQPRSRLLSQIKDSMRKLTNAQPSGAAGTAGTNRTPVQGNENTQLKQAIQQTKPFTQNQLYSPQHVDVPAPQPIECEPNQAHDLRFSAKGLHLRCFVRRDMPDLSSAELQECQRFEMILIACANVFQCSTESLHIYLNPETKTVAFNCNGSLFFNLWYFLKSLTTGSQRPLTGSWNPVEALDYWFPVMAHELAHNLVSSHGANHSFFTESYIQHYLERFKEISAEWANK